LSPLAACRRAPRHLHNLHLRVESLTLVAGAAPLAAGPAGYISID
jgi:hypothetical protein